MEGEFAHMPALEHIPVCAGTGDVASADEQFRDAPNSQSVLCPSSLLGRVEPSPSGSTSAVPAYAQVNFQALSGHAQSLRLIYSVHSSRETTFDCGVG